MSEELSPTTKSDIVAESTGAPSGADEAEAGADDAELSPLRAMYRRLAREYEKWPTVPDCRGGVKGDRYPF
jgi:hypothetical protein